MSNVIPNTDQLGAVVRWVLTLAGTWAASHGYISQDMVTMIIGAVIALLPIVWSLYIKTNAEKTKAASTVPGVTVGVADDAPKAVLDLTRDTKHPRIVALADLVK